MALKTDNVKNRYSRNMTDTDFSQIDLLSTIMINIDDGSLKSSDNTYHSYRHLSQVD